MHVDIYTDGAARGNPGPGGYGTVLRFVDSKGAVHEKELSQGYERTTNNRMELMAVVAGLEVLKRPCSITLYSDSQYVVNAFNQHWVDGWLKRGWKNAQKQPVKNDDLWKRLLAAKEACGPSRERALRRAGHDGRRRRGAHSRRGLQRISEDSEAAPGSPEVRMMFLFDFQAVS